MIHPYSSPPAVSNLRHHRRQRTLAVMLAFAGTVACGENPTGPRSPELAPAKQLTVPTVVSLVTQVDFNAAKAEVENSRIGVNDMNSQTYAGNPEIQSLYTSYTPPLDAPPPPPYLPPPTCEGAECPLAYSVEMSGFAPPVSLTAMRRMPGTRPPVNSPQKPRFLWADDGIGGTGPNCQFYRDEIRRLGANYARAYQEFWTNVFPETWKLPSNWWIGGPVDQMRYNFQQMFFVRLAYQSQGCPGRPPRGGWTTPGL